MRGWILTLALVLGAWLLAGCESNEPPVSRVLTTSMLAFRYDDARGLALAATYPLNLTVNDLPPDYAVLTNLQSWRMLVNSITPQRYATALAGLPAVSYLPGAEQTLGDPAAVVRGNVVTVNYRAARGLATLSRTQATAVLAALEAWWWVPGVSEVHVQANGQPLAALGPVALTDPLTRVAHTYVLNPNTGEIGYLVGGLSPTTPPEALDILKRREVLEFPATQGFLPLLPPNLAPTVGFDKITDNTLPVDISPNTYSAQQQHPRLAGLVLTFSQFPQVSSLRFTFDQLTVSQSFMRGNLEKPLAVYDLLLPPETAVAATGPAATGIQTAVQAYLGKTPKSYGAALTWERWACVTVQPADPIEEKTVLLSQDVQGYSVKSTAARLTARQALVDNIPRPAIIAFRLPGCETVALEGEKEEGKR